MGVLKHGKLTLGLVGRVSWMMKSAMFPTSISVRGEVGGASSTIFMTGK